MTEDQGREAPLRVVVVGAGAVGSFLGGTLAASGADVTLLARRRQAHPDATALRIHEPDGERTVPVRWAAGPDGLAAPDLVIVAVKAFDLDGALATAARWPGAAVLTAQNGVGAEAVADAWIPYPTPLLAASVTTALEPAPDGVTRLRAGGIGVAVVRDDDTARGAALAGTLVARWTSGGLEATLVQGADAMKWSKLLANLVGNATSAILDLDPAAIYRDGRTYAIERAQLLEALAVMGALGLEPVALPGADVRTLLRGIRLPAVIGRPLVARGIAGARGGKSPSLRLHVRGGGSGPTEVAWLNGAVAAAGAAEGVPTPVNAALAGLVQEVAADPDRAAWFKGEPARLVEAVASWQASS
ncbi:MAG TPA: 2-dehydropantoate 2-reductase [Candidatus Limnocylindrales bacterium]|nr:2-dehydropantoate 2-reductase [Candidatus Limnocylindrales bacterium]